MKFFPGIMLYLVLALFGPSFAIANDEVDSLDEIEIDDLEDQAVIFGSFRHPDTPLRMHFRLQPVGEDWFLRVNGEDDLEIRAQGTDRQFLFALLVDPGKYQFPPSSSLATQREKYSDIPVPKAPLNVAAGDVLYLGNVRCIAIMNGCEWLVTDEWARDVSEAEKMHPVIAWQQARRADLAFNASWLHEKFEIESLGEISGDARVNAFSLALPAEYADFVREGAVNYGNGNVMIRYRDRLPGSASYDVVVYPASTCPAADDGTCDEREHAMAGLYEAYAAMYAPLWVFAGAKNTDTLEDVFIDTPLALRRLLLDVESGSANGADRGLWHPVIGTFHERGAEPITSWNRIAVFVRNGQFLKLRLRHFGTRQEAMERFDAFYAQVLGARLQVMETEAVSTFQTGWDARVSQ